MVAGTGRAVELIKRYEEIEGISDLLRRERRIPYVGIRRYPSD
jgi:hypothetical protein